MSKIGVAITTFNSEAYFDELYASLPLDKIDELVVVNGGKEYSKPYDKCHWIQHDTVKFASVARNDGLKFLQQKDCDYYFIIEDDMLIKNPNVFDEYIKHSNVTGLEYLCFASNAWETGPPHARTPRLKVQYDDTTSINFYKHTCNEFTFRTRNLLNTVGLYDENFQIMFDIDSLYRMYAANFIKFWYFPDISDSDNYVANNPNAISRMNADGKRDASHNMQLFVNKHGKHIGQIESLDQNDFITFLKNTKP
jgi:glycosyltransferase involved in cell wall biosynthesis